MEPPGLGSGPLSINSKILPGVLGQVVGNAIAHNPRADNDHVCVARYTVHQSLSLSVFHVWSVNDHLNTVVSVRHTDPLSTSIMRCALPIQNPSTFACSIQIHRAPVVFQEKPLTHFEMVLTPRFLQQAGTLSRVSGKI